VENEKDLKIGYNLFHFSSNLLVEQVLYANLLSFSHRLSFTFFWGKSQERKEICPPEGKCKGQSVGKMRSLSFCLTIVFPHLRTKRKRDVENRSGRTSLIFLPFGWKETRSQLCSGKILFSFS